MEKLFKLLNSDKTKHLTYCFFVASMGSLLNIYIGIAMASAAAITKEIYDIRHSSFTPDNILDLIADAVGIILAWTVWV